LKKITYLYLIFASAVFFFMALSGLNNECVPGKDIKELSFYSLSGKTKGILIKRMADFKEEHKEIVEKNLYDGIIWQFLPPEGYLLDMERENKENIGGETLYISKNKMRWMSNNLISPSVWDEPLGLTILETMASRTPVVATRKGGIPTLVKHGQNGFLIPARNAGKIAQACNKLLEDDELRRRLGEQARKTVEEKFTWKIIAEKTDRLYRQVLRNGKNGKK